LVTPLGAWVGKYIGSESMEHDITWLIAVVCGTFIHISTTIIFESSGKAHRISIYKFLAILAGVGVSFISRWL
jgi:hypothetical protein